MKPFSLTTAFYFETGPPGAPFSAPLLFRGTIYEERRNRPCLCSFSFLDLILMTS